MILLSFKLQYNDPEGTINDMSSYGEPGGN